MGELSNSCKGTIVRRVTPGTVVDMDDTLYLVIQGDDMSFISEKLLCFRIIRNNHEEKLENPTVYSCEPYYPLGDTPCFADQAPLALENASNIKLPDYLYVDVLRPRAIDIDSLVDFSDLGVVKLAHQNDTNILIELQMLLTNNREGYLQYLRDKKPGVLLNIILPMIKEDPINEEPYKKSEEGKRALEVAFEQIQQIKDSQIINLENENNMSIQSHSKQIKSLNQDFSILNSKLTIQCGELEDVTNELMIHRQKETLWATSNHPTLSTTPSNIVPFSLGAHATKGMLVEQHERLFSNAISEGDNRAAKHSKAPNNCQRSEPECISMGKCLPLMDDKLSSRSSTTNLIQAHAIVNKNLEGSGAEKRGLRRGLDDAKTRIIKQNNEFFKALAQIQQADDRARDQYAQEVAELGEATRNLQDSGTCNPIQLDVADEEAETDAAERDSLIFSIDDLGTKVHHLEDGLAEANRSATQNNESLRERNVEISALKKLICKLQISLDNKSGENLELHSKLVASQKMVEGKNSEITKLKNIIGEIIRDANLKTTLLQDVKIQCNKTSYDKSIVEDKLQIAQERIDHLQGYIESKSLPIDAQSVDTLELHEGKIFQLEKDIEAAEECIKTNEYIIHKYEQTLEERDDNFHAANDTIDKLSADLYDARAEVERSLETIRSLEADNKKANEDFIELDEIYSRLTNKVDKKCAQVNELNNAGVSTEETKLALTEAESKIKYYQMESAIYNVDDLKRQLDETKRDLALQETTMISKVGEIKDLEEQKGELEESLRHKEETIEKHEGTIKKIEGNLKLHNNIAHIQKDVISKKQNEVATYQEELSKTTQALTTCEESLKNYRVHYEAVVERLRERRYNQDLSMKDVRQKLAATETNNKERLLQLNQQIAYNNDLADQLVLAKSNITEVKDVVQEKELDLDRVNDEMAVLSAQYKAAQASAAELKNKLVEQSSNLATNQAQAATDKRLLHEKLFTAEYNHKSALEKAAQAETAVKIMSKALDMTKTMLHSTQISKDKLRHEMTSTLSRFNSTNIELDTVRDQLLEYKTKFTTTQNELRASNTVNDARSSEVVNLTSVLEMAMKEYELTVNALAIKKKEHILMTSLHAGECRETRYLLAEIHDLRAEINKHKLADEAREVEIQKLLEETSPGGAEEVVEYELEMTETSTPTKEDDTESEVETDDEMPELLSPIQRAEQAVQEAELGPSPPPALLAMLERPRDFKLTHPVLEEQEPIEKFNIVSKEADKDDENDQFESETVEQKNVESEVDVISNDDFSETGEEEWEEVEDLMSKP